MRIRKAAAGDLESILSFYDSVGYSPGASANNRIFLAESGDRITGFNHLTLAVRDIDESFEFYKDVLAFKPIQKSPESAYLKSRIEAGKRDWGSDVEWFV